jgi:hypothetical protein
MNSFSALFGILLFSFSVSAADGGGRFNFNAREKLEKKESSRWTLQEWLAQKERNRMMDLWLGMYAPSPYEFYLKGTSNSFTSSTDPLSTPEKSYQTYSGGIGAYATIVGLEGDYENNWHETYNDLTGSFNLRILGNAVQGTHLIAKYGLRTRTGTSAGQGFKIANQFWGGDLNLYLTRYFGLQGLYHSYLPAEEALFGTVTGTRTEAGAFIDFNIIRVFGVWYNDVQKNELSGTTTTLQRTGTQIGLKIFF